MGTLRLLPPNLINQIAAGEVVERPCAALKELVENALDAKATHIDVALREGGKSYLSVSDNGFGMTPDELSLCLERHATSKLPEDDLSRIMTFGFRGEALPSIGSVARLTVTSRKEGASDAWTIGLEGGTKTPLAPSSRPQGTKVAIRDLFYATPARLKFLKKTPQETRACLDILHLFALKHHDVGFRCVVDDKEVMNLAPGPFQDRLREIMGQDFHDNHIPLDIVQGDHRVHGVLSLPTLNKNISLYNYLFVNGRAIKDKVFHQCLKVAYQDVIPHGRFPMSVVFFDLPHEALDVNVHPSKTEVRFQDPNQIRTFFIRAFKDALQTITYRATDSIRQDIFKRATSFIQPKLKVSGSFTPPPAKPWRHPESAPIQRALAQQTALSSPGPNFQDKATPNLGVAESPRSLTPSGSPDLVVIETTAIPDVQAPDVAQETETPFETPPLGYAKAQILNTYILAQNSEGLVMVDQHAVHERIIYESLKKQRQEQGFKRQGLLIPEIVSLKADAVQALEPYFGTLLSLGLLVERFSATSVMIREIPQGTQDFQWASLLDDMANEMLEGGEPQSLETKILEKMATAACHNSIRAGQKLSIDEMNAMLRQMETTPFGGQCNHGRPTYVVLRQEDLEKLFHRR